VRVSSKIRLDISMTLIERRGTDHVQSKSSLSGNGDIDPSDPGP